MKLLQSKINYYVMMVTEGHMTIDEVNSSYKEVVKIIIDDNK